MRDPPPESFRLGSRRIENPMGMGYLQSPTAATIDGCGTDTTSTGTGEYADYSSDTCSSGAVVDFATSCLPRNGERQEVNRRKRRMGHRMVEHVYHRSLVLATLALGSVLVSRSLLNTAAVSKNNSEASPDRGIIATPPGVGEAGYTRSTSLRKKRRRTRRKKKSMWSFQRSSYLSDFVHKQLGIGGHHEDKDAAALGEDTLSVEDLRERRLVDDHFLSLYKFDPPVMHPSGYVNNGFLPEPYLGQIRPENDVVIAMIDCNDLKEVVQFVGPLVSEDGGNFDGDVVLILLHAQGDIDPAVHEYLRHVSLRSYANVVAYAWEDWKCWNRKFPSLKYNKPFLSSLCKMPASVYGQEDTRPPRGTDIILLELSRVVLTRYQAQARVLLVEPAYTDDLLFQADPFEDLSPYGTGMSNLHLFEKPSIVTIGSDPCTLLRMTAAYGEDTKVVTTQMKDQFVVSSAVVLGYRNAVVAYTNGMVGQYDRTMCEVIHCASAFVNALYYSGLLRVATNIDKVVLHERGTGAGSELGAFENIPLNKMGITRYVEEKWVVVQQDGETITPMAYPLDQNPGLRTMRDVSTNLYMEEWKGFLEEQYGSDCAALEGTPHYVVLGCGQNETSVVV